MLLLMGGEGGYAGREGRSEHGKTPAVVWPKEGEVAQIWGGGGNVYEEKNEMIVIN